MDKMHNNKDYSERRGSLIVLSVTIVIILVIVLVGVCVMFLVEKQVARIVLFCLIALLLLIALLACLFLESRRRDAQRKRDKGASDLVKHIYEEQRHQMQPSTSQTHTLDGKTATWALTQPWRYSQRSTLRA